MSEEITIKNGKKVNIDFGDVVFVTLSSTENSLIVRGKYISFDGKLITISVLNPNFDFINVTVKPSRITKFEKPD